MKKTPEGRKRLEEADRKIHEYLESKLVEEHGVKDEAERPGITGSKPEAVQPTVDAQPSGDPSAGDDTPSAPPGAGGSKSASSPPCASSSTPGTQEKKTKKQSGTKRAAEEEGDDADRGDRKSWRNYIEPASSNAAPEVKVTSSTAVPDAKGTKRETKDEEERRGKKITKAGGVKRTAEEEADDGERADRRSRGDEIEPTSPSQGVDIHMAADPALTQIVPATDKRDLAVPSEESGSPQKLPKISSICFGIGSADKI